MAEHLVDVDPDAGHGSVQAVTGDVVVVRVPENPTTGYAWRLTTEGALRLDGDRLVRATGVAAGAGGVREYRVQVHGPGPARLLLDLARAWEDQPHRTVIVDVLA